MLRRVQQTILERNLIKPGATIVAAVSGGADSTALLYALWFLRERLKFHVCAAHLHHGLRGKDADRDAELVERHCAWLGIPLRLECVVPGSLERRGVSIEMAARQARHDFFKRTLVEFQADAMAVAHHRDDQAETVLMRLLSGSGMDGLGGMDYTSEPAPGLPVIRPMLDVSRLQIEVFLRKHRLQWREDKSNRQLSFVRNRVRHNIFPALKKHGFPGAAAALVRLSDIMREEARVLEIQTTRIIKRCRVPKNSKALHVDRVARLPVAEQRRVLRWWLSGLVSRERSIDFQLIEQSRQMLTGKGKRVLVLDAKRTIAKKGSLLSLNAVRPKQSGNELAAVELRVPGVTMMDQAGLIVKVTKSKGFRKLRQRIGQFPVEANIRRDPGEIPRLMLRGRQPGDRLVPTGMSGSVSVKELLIDQKIPADQRSTVPVISCGSDVLYVAGYRVSQAWSVKSSTSPSWRLVIEQKARK